MHMRRTHNQLELPFSCTICGFRCSEQFKLIDHFYEVLLVTATFLFLFNMNLQDVLYFHLTYVLLPFDRLNYFQIHKNGEKLQCPHCLKCVAVGNQGKKLAANVVFFMQHVKKHQLNTSSQKCDRCSLLFMRKGIIKEHLNSDHVSFSENPSMFLSSL